MGDESGDEEPFKRDRAATGAGTGGNVPGHPWARLPMAQLSLSAIQRGWKMASVCFSSSPAFPTAPPEQEAAAPPAPRGAPGQWGSGLTQEKGWGSSAVRRHWGNPPHPQPKRGNRAPRNPLMGAPWLRAVQKAWDSHAKESCL